LKSNINFEILKVLEKPSHFALPRGRERVLEAATGFEPVIRALQARALPLGYAAFWPPPSGHAVEEA
jgi:hypothetical protein